jgi:hypothetical protein
MIKSICDYSKRKNLNPRDSFFPRLAVDQDSGQFKHFRDPPTILFTFGLDSHDRILLCKM